MGRKPRKLHGHTERRLRRGASTDAPVRTQGCQPVANQGNAAIPDNIGGTSWENDGVRVVVPCAPVFPELLSGSARLEPWPDALRPRMYGFAPFSLTDAAGRFRRPSPAERAEAIAETLSAARLLVHAGHSLLDAIANSAEHELAAVWAVEALRAVIPDRSVPAFDARASQAERLSAIRRLIGKRRPKAGGGWHDPAPTETKAELRARVRRLEQLLLAHGIKP